jgi:hypothetical protein
VKLRAWIYTKLLTKVERTKFLVRLYHICPTKIRAPDSMLRHSGGSSPQVTYSNTVGDHGRLPVTYLVSVVLLLNGFQSTAVFYARERDAFAWSASPVSEDICCRCTFMARTAGVTFDFKVRKIFSMRKLNFGLWCYGLRCRVIWYVVTDVSKQLLPFCWG